jgi:predicted house-cleaning noncanonical NTP pyrophosphatase (MazG superfamily)
MAVKIYNKLVRDKIPDVIASKGQVASFRQLGDQEFRLHLKLKLLEETTEAMEASSNGSLLDELADLVEVVEALTVDLGFTAAEIRARQEKKRAERGGFEKRIFLEKVDEK